MIQTVDLDEYDVHVDGSPKNMKIPSGAVDWTVYLTNEKTVLEYSEDAYMPLRSGETHTVVARKPDRYVIYVLAPTEEDLEKARENFKDFPWAVPIMIPTTFYLEGVMYTHILHRRRKEWEHADYVGTISHSAPGKLHDISAVYRTMRAGSKEGAQVTAFLHRGDSLVATAEKWHPGFLRIWAGSLRYLGFPMEQILNEEIPSFYCNYWAATPPVMKEYIQFFRTYVHTLDTLPIISDEVWNDASYSGRGLDIAGIPSDHCMKIWGVPQYPFHPFILERLPCFFFWALSKKTVVSSC